MLTEIDLKNTRLLADDHAQGSGEFFSPRPRTPATHRTTCKSDGSRLIMRGRHAEGGRGSGGHGSVPCHLFRGIERSRIQIRPPSLKSPFCQDDSLNWKQKHLRQDFLEGAFSFESPSHGLAMPATSKLRSAAEEGEFLIGIRDDW